MGELMQPFLGVPNITVRSTTLSVGNVKSMQVPSRKVSTGFSRRKCGQIVGTALRLEQHGEIIGSLFTFFPAPKRIIAEAFLSTAAPMRAALAALICMAEWKICCVT